MKKTTKENIAISQFIENTLGITFNNEEFSLGRWGETDNWCQVSHDTLILLECEKSQKHPNTNVLKIYPYLEEFPKVQIIFLHYFFPENKAPKNRVALCNFLGKKLEHEFGIRFQYLQLRCQSNQISVELKKRKTNLLSSVPNNVIK